MDLSINEHIRWASSPRLISEDANRQQSTSVTQLDARDWFEKLYAHQIYIVQKYQCVLAVMAQCLEIINKSVKEKESLKIFPLFTDLRNSRFGRDSYYITRRSDPLLAHQINSDRNTWIAPGEIVSG